MYKLATLNDVIVFSIFYGANILYYAYLYLLFFYLTVTLGLNIEGSCVMLSFGFLNFNSLDIVFFSLGTCPQFADTVDRTLIRYS